MQIVLKLGMLTIEEIETELMNNFQFLKLRNRNLRRCSYEESIAFYFHDGLCIRNVRL